MSAILETLQTAVTFIIDTVTNFFSLFASIPDYLSTIYDVFAILPSEVLAAFTVTVSIILIWMIVGLGPRG